MTDDLAVKHKIYNVTLKIKTHFFVFFFHFNKQT